MSDKPKVEVFLCVVEHEGDPHPRGFKVGTSVDDLAKWAEDKNAPDGENVEETKKVEDEKVLSLSDLIYSIAATGNHQSELISLTSAVKSSFPMAMFKTEVVDKVFKDDHLEKSGETYKICKIEDGQVPSVVSSMEQIGRLRDGLNYLPTAIFLSLIATFDTQMSDIVRSMLRIKSDRLKFSTRQVPLSKIMAATDISEIVEEQIIEEVYSFSRGSHNDQVAFIEENFAIEIRDKWSRWPDFIEIFERRNLVAHGERRYTRRYVDICTEHKFNDAKQHVGELVTLNRSYLFRSLNILSEFGILTIFMLWRKHVAKEKDQSFDVLNEVAFNCINSNRSRLAARLCEFALSLKNSGVKEAPRLRLVVNLASALMHLKEDKESERILNREDWSATSDDFQISVAALRKDVAEVNRILPMIKASEKLSAAEFRSWPVFNFIKDDDRFLAKFEEVYGEPLVVANPIVEGGEQAAIGDEGEGDGEPSATTMH